MTAVLYSTSSDASGNFSFTNLSVGAFNLKAVHQASLSEGTVMGTIPDNGASVTQDVVIYKVADVAKGNVTGKVFGADGTTPKVGAVVIVKVGQNYQNWMRSQADGSFSFTGVYAGSLTLTVRDDATGEKSIVSGTVTDGNTSVFTVIMSGTGTVNGTVTRGDGKSAEGLYVVASVNDLKWVLQTDLNAAFSFASLPIGDIRIEVLDPRDFNRTIASGTVTLLAAGDIQIISLFAPDTALATGTIQGTVYRRDGSIWPNAEVRLLVENLSYYTYKADSQGKYSINSGARYIPARGNKRRAWRMQQQRSGTAPRSRPSISVPCGIGTVTRHDLRLRGESQSHRRGCNPGIDKAERGRLAGIETVSRPLSRAIL